MWPEFFLQTLLGLVITEVWDFTVDKIKKVYKEHKDVPEDQKTFQSRMYTAIIDAFCVYTGINPDEAQDDVMDFICRTAKEYYDQSYKNQDTSTDNLLSAINTLESRFGNTLLEKENTEDKNKIALISDYIQVYISKDPAFRDIYVIKAFDYLKHKGEQIEKNQLELKMFAKDEIDKAVFRINSHTDQVGNRVIAVLIKRIDALEERILNNPVSNSTESKTVDSEFKDTKTEYVDKWNERLFLHRKPEDEELTLHNTYIPTLYNIIRPEDERTILPQDNLNEKLEQFYDYGKSLLLIGSPGIGKTSVVCYLADKYKNDPDVIILRFSDWSEEEWTGYENKRHGSILMKAITSKLECSEKDLRNKLLILDGFDEIKYYSCDYDILKSFILQIRNIKGFRVIITSRDNYIKIERVKFQNVIKLCPFNDDKIKKYAEKVLHYDKFVTKKLGDTEVYGIPVILYMALTTGIDITDETNRCSAYEKIFSLDSGIFDRFATESDPGYDECASHDISFVKEAFYDILCKTAYVMFENANKGIFIDRGKYKEVINEVGSKMPCKTSLWYDFPIDNLYDKGDRIEFVHKSIYEYFTAMYLYENIINHTLRDVNNSDLLQDINIFVNEEIIKKGKYLLASHFKRGALSKEILEYLKYKIIKDGYKSLGNIYFTKVFNDMVINGMMSSYEYCKDGYSLEKECTIFSNMLEFLHLWIDTDKEVIKFDKASVWKISVYIKLCSNLRNKTLNDPYQKPWFMTATSMLNLSNFDLSECDLSNITLEEANFSNSILKKANFNSSVLIGSNFENANLFKAHMNKAKLQHTRFCYSGAVKTDFTDADMSNANFQCSSVDDAILTGAKTDGAIFKDVSGMETAIYTTEYEGMALSDYTWEGINIHEGCYGDPPNAQKEIK